MVGFSITAPMVDDTTLNDVVASPVLGPPVSPASPSKKFALPSHLEGGFRQWEPS